MSRLEFVAYGPDSPLFLQAISAGTFALQSSPHEPPSPSIDCVIPGAPSLTTLCPRCANEPQRRYRGGCNQGCNLVQARILASLLPIQQRTVIVEATATVVGPFTLVGRTGGSKRFAALQRLFLPVKMCRRGL